MSLRNKVAIVTGAASGIGRSIAQKLAENGANVMIADIRKNPRSSDQELPTVDTIRENGGTAAFHKTDVTSPTDVQELVTATIDEFDALDILVNNAGISHNTSVHESSIDEWDETLSVNLKSIFLCTKYAYPHLLESESPRIINIASQHGVVGSKESGPYCASKGGVINLTRQMAIDYTPEGITVNAISPGPILTAMFTDVPGVEEKINSYKDEVLTDRLGRPEDIANAAIFLADDTAEYITGHNLVVDGGYIAH